MNYQKLDAALSLELERVENPEEPYLVIFIYIQSIPTAEAMTHLECLGAQNLNGAGSIITATLSVQMVSEVSQQSWVKYLRLSQVLYPIQNRDRA